MKRNIFNKNIFTILFLYQTGKSKQTLHQVPRCNSDIYGVHHHNIVNEDSKYGNCVPLEYWIEFSDCHIFPVGSMIWCNHTPKETNMFSIPFFNNHQFSTSTFHVLHCEWFISYNFQMVETNSDYYYFYIS
jgi:hypothetical protein